MTTILTSAQTCGPLFGFALFPQGLNHSVDPASPHALTIEGCVFDGAGESVGHATWIEFWWQGQSCRARTVDGRYEVTVARPRAVVVAGVGQLAPQLAINIFTRGLARPLITRMYLPDEPAANAADPALARVPRAYRDRLVATPGRDAARLVYDIHLQGPQESVFFDLVDDSASVSN